jgi:AraC-like DNA-binding protein
MKVTCPNCHRSFAIGGLGRKSLNLPVTIVCDSLKRTHSVSTTAELLGCSRALVYKILKRNGLKAKDIMMVSVKRLRKKKHDGQ